MSSLSSCHNISDLRKRAKRKLPKPMFDYIDGGADDEWSLRRNTDAFDDYELLPNYLKNIEAIDLKTKVLGTEIALPFFLSPTGMSRLFHYEKEYAASNAAHAHGTMYSLSTMATTSIEDIAASNQSPKMFQIYIFKDRELTREFVKRCKAAGYQALCLTVDTPLAGNRERDLYNGMTLPPKMTVKSFFSYAMSIEWVLSLLKDANFQLANVVHRVGEVDNSTMGLLDYVNSQFDRTVTWEDAAWLAEEWGGPFVIKGVQSAEDAKQAQQIGASALMVSNHGGRQLEGVPAPVDCIRPIRDAIGNDLELIVDGGIRRGTHILKALALGADACSIGRPYLYGLAAGGQAGVDKAITILKQELERSMALLGVDSIQAIKQSHIKF